MKEKFNPDNPEKRFVKKGDNEAGYPEYTFESQTDDSESAIQSDDEQWDVKYRPDGSVESMVKKGKEDAGDLERAATFPGGAPPDRSFNNEEEEVVAAENGEEDITEKAIKELNPDWAGLGETLSGLLGKTTPGAVARAAALTGFIVAGEGVIKGKGQEESDIYKHLDIPDINSETVTSNERGVPKTPEFLVPQKSKENVDEEISDAFDEKVAEAMAEIDPVDIKMTKQNAEKKLEEFGNMKVADYIKNEIVLRPWNKETGKGLPSVVIEELRDYFEGVYAVEARFTKDRVSDAEAVGYFQITKDNWEKYGGKPDEYESLVKGAEIAGELWSDKYDQLVRRLGEETLNFLATKYFADEDTFQKDFMVPLLINSYVAGDGRMAQAVEVYLEETPHEEIPSGKELFVSISDFAKNSKKEKLKGYGKRSHRYVYDAKAWTLALQDTKG